MNLRKHNVSFDEERKIYEGQERDDFIHGNARKFCKGIRGNTSKLITPTCSPSPDVANSTDEAVNEAASLIDLARKSTGPQKRPRTTRKRHDATVKTLSFFLPRERRVK